MNSGDVRSSMINMYIDDIPAYLAAAPHNAGLINCVQFWKEHKKGSDYYYTSNDDLFDLLMFLPADATKEVIGELLKHVYDQWIDYHVVADRLEKGKRYYMVHNLLNSVQVSDYTDEMDDAEYPNLIKYVPRY